MPQSTLTRDELHTLRAFTWVSYMMSHESEEMSKLLKYGTPSDELIRLTDKSIEMTTSEGRTRKIFFPESLNTSRGQKLLYKVAVKVNTYLKTVPIQAHDLLQDIKAKLQVRRADAKANILIVAEAVLHRAATEFKHEVLFAFDSINIWVKSAYGKELGYLTIRKALEVLQDQEFIKVREWGKRGNRSKCTKIEIIPSPRNYILTYTSDVDDWLLCNDHAMSAVYRRESTTRQDVLESKFHHYADEFAVGIVEESRWAQGIRLIPTSDDRMAVVEVVPSGVAVVEEGKYDQVYIDRLLGRLVQPLQEDGSYSRQSYTNSG